MKNTIKDMVVVPILMKFRRHSRSLKLVNNSVLSDVWNTVAGSIIDSYELDLRNCVEDQVEQKLK